MSLTFREKFSTEKEAKNLVDQLIHGGIIQKQGEFWIVWQINN
jgi:hypothetical protein